MTEPSTNGIAAGLAGEEPDKGVAVEGVWHNTPAAHFPRACTPPHACAPALIRGRCDFAGDEPDKGGAEEGLRAQLPLVHISPMPALTRTHSRTHACPHVDATGLGGDGPEKGGAVEGVQGGP